jgi:hypothetical protein
VVSIHVISQRGTYEVLEHMEVEDGPCGLDAHYFLSAAILGNISYIL